MAEYIEREALLKDIDSSTKNSGMGYVICQTFKRYVKRQTPADVAPVRHGRWFWADDGYCRCSECKQKAPVIRQWDDEPMTTMTYFCPHCGAKMDGGGDG